MLKDFESIKGQLAELADVINKFKSEAVQLRIVELLFRSHRPGDQEEEEEKPPKPNDSSAGRKSARRRRKRSNGESADRKPARKSSGGTGAVATLVKVYDEGFFSSARTINDILRHCETNLARRIKANEISGKLARMVRSGDPPAFFGPSVTSETRLPRLLLIRSV